MTHPKETTNSSIFSQTIRIYQNLATADPHTVFDAMDINQHTLEQRYAEQVAEENRMRSEEIRTGRRIRTG